jgi:hypothetical protein
MDRRHLLVHTTALLSLSLAGCFDSIGSLGDDHPQNRTRTTARETATTDQTTGQTTESVQTVSLVELPTFPEGPKERPTPPNVWDEASAKSFAKKYEERRLYNEYYREEVTEITISCTTPDVERIENGYEVSLRCQGAIYEEDSKTHSDYIGPRIVYRLTPTAVTRERSDSAN